MKKESDFDMAKSKHPLFQTMVEISKLYDSRLQEINQQALNVFSNNGWAHTLQDIGEKVSWITAGSKDTVPESLKAITESIGKSYTNVFSSGDHMYPLSDAIALPFPDPDLTWLFSNNDLVISTFPVKT